MPTHLDQLLAPRDVLEKCELLPFRSLDPSELVLPIRHHFQAFRQLAIASVQQLPSRIAIIFADFVQQFQCFPNGADQLSAL